MRGTNLWPARTLRIARASPPGDELGDDTSGIRPALSGDRGSAVWTGGARVAGIVPAPGFAHQDCGTVPGRGQHASRAGCADGGTLGAARGSEPACGPRFEQLVAPGGYAWWYLDALSDDGGHGLTVIAFIGSVFSPYYAWARRRGPANPLEHCALNVSLYEESGKRWAMTERAAAKVQQSAGALAIGPSSLTWDGAALEIAIDEITAPIPSRIRGTLRLYPEALFDHAVTLDTSGHHRWRPIAPGARIEVRLSQPSLNWSGTAYLDSNDGDRPLEDDFSDWDWSRARLAKGNTAVLYDVRRLDGSDFSLAKRFNGAGAIDDFAAPPEARLAATSWGIARNTRADKGHHARVLQTLESGPFYARSLVATRIGGEAVSSMHESLSLMRFRRPWVQAMLPFRMPRALR